MTDRRWKLVVTELGRSDALHAVVVEAGDWMTALGRARALAGERGGVPPGASCAVDAEGTVTILDGVARRQYLLTATSEAATAAAASGAAAAAAGGAAAKKKVSKATVAYMQSPLAAAGVAMPGGAPIAGAQTAPRSAPVSAPAASASAAPAAAPAPAASASARPASVPAPAAVSVPKPASVPPGAAAAADLAKAKSKQTVAYVPPAQAASAQPAPSAPAQAAPAATAQPARAPQAATEPATAPDATKKKVSKQTVAYLPNAPELLAHAKSAAAAAATTATAAAVTTAAAPASTAPTSEPAATEATPAAAAPTVPSEAAPAPVSPTAPPEPAAIAPGAAVSVAPAAAPSVPADGAEVLYARDGEPTAETPLTYRERTFVVAAGTTADDAEMIVRRRFAALREELEARPKGKLVNMAVFDHRWEGRPQRPPLVALQWKDWRGEPDIQRPTAIASTPPPATSMPPVSHAPPAQAAPSTPAPVAAPGARQRLSTPSPDDRLTQAFESLQDLFFLGSPLEGADFVVNLLADLVPCEASSVCLYDINTDELRFVALRGMGADERKGEAIPLGLGLIGAAAQLTQPMLVEDVGTDPRFDPGIDGRVGLDPSTMALVPIVHQGRLQAVVQLVNRQGQAQFGKADSNVLVYVGEKLGEFLQQSRLAAQPSPSQRAPRR